MKRSLMMLLFVLVAAACQEQAAPQLPNVPADKLEEAAVQPTGKPMLPAYKVAGDFRPAKADQYDDYRNAHPELFGITVPPSVSVRPVAEYEDAAKLMITVSSTSLPSGMMKNLVDIVKYGKNVVDVYIIYDSSSIKSNFTSKLQAAGVSTSGLNWLNLENDTVWIRDYGPIPIISATNKNGIIDTRYYHQRIYDDALPTKLGNLWNATVYRAPLDFEGGNFMSDSKGNCFASEGILWYNAVGQTQLTTYFKDYLGCTNLHIMKTLANEGTTHIDMQMKLASDTTVIVGEYGQNQDYQNYQVTNQNAATFTSLGYDVVRMPMPSNSDGNFRTFINSLFVNGVNMVPVYSIDKNKEAQAMAIWQQVMPTWQHVPMNSDDVIQWAGAIHCITMTTGNGSFSAIENTPAYACGGDWSCNPGSSGGGCDGITYEGCCDGNTLKYCENNQLKSMNCGNQPQCGWDSQNKFYNCGTNGGADPSGQFPKDCGGGCTPNCTGKECGTDGCGGSCGTCGGGETCSNGQCVPQGDPCDGITFEGCCEGSTLKYCEGDQIKTIDCSGNPQCGWKADANYYDCGTNGSGDPSGEFPKSCDGGCVPNCTGKECGTDGCGGSCGTCGANESCQNGQCVAGCTPNCTGKECGTDGCGGSCGTCAAGESCKNYQCVANCVPNCTGKECGDDGCGGSCGTCAAGELCQQGQCNAVEDTCLGVSYEGCCDGTTLHWCEGSAIQTLECAAAGCGWNGQANYYDCNQSGADPSGNNPIDCPGGSCIPNCADKQCGDDGCGGTCGTCPVGSVCQAGMCIGGGGCGDVTYAGYCDGEVLVWCENDQVNMADCSKLDGNFKCQFWADGDGYYCVEQPECVPSCTGKECGDDGCGGSCGSCPQGESCKNGTCEAGPCQPDCTGKECGDDGCGGSCGTCIEGETCTNGHCVADCQPDCTGFECGGDGCGGSCGVCPAGFSCENHLCVQGCQPACDGKECGSDGCGGLCGSCADGEVCTDGQCASECQPSCTGKECGPDGCGGTCGSCPKSYTCDDGDCVADPEGCGNVTTVGKCEGDVLYKCVTSQVLTIDCAETGKVCSFVPSAGVFDCVEQCIPNCSGKECGSDGCGGTCGTCMKGESCDAGKCVDQENPCVPNCAGMECGDDGCGGSCGVCGEGLACQAGLCTTDEIPGDVDVIEETTGGTEEPVGDGEGKKSGGCTTSSSSNAAGTILLLGLALALAAFRRFALSAR